MSFKRKGIVIKGHLKGGRGVKILGILTAILCLAVGTSAQDVYLAAKAEAFRQEVVKHPDPAWLSGFMEAFLGKNHAKSQPGLSKTLEGVAKADAIPQIVTALDAYAGDRAGLDTVLGLAVGESRTWTPGMVLRQETVNSLWSLLYKATPDKGFTPRLEPYPVPESIRTWLVEEQEVNDKIMRFPSLAARGTLASELDPLNKPIFWLPHVEIPVEEARILEAGQLSQKTSANFFLQRDGRTYVRYFIHPGSLSSPSIRKLLKTHPIRVEYLSTPTSSPRSLAVWNPYSNDSFFLVKASLAATVGGLRRINPTDKGMRAVTTTRALDAYYAQHLGGRAPPFLREPMVVFPAGSDFGMIVREVPESFPSSESGRFVPGSSIFSKRPDGKEPLLVEMIRKSGRPPVEYVREKVLEPLMRLYGEVTFGQGLVGEPHQQNVLFEIGPDGEFTGRVIFRDLDSYKIDLEQRLRKGLPIRGFFDYADPGVIGNFKLTKGRSYYWDSYLEYVREDWGFLLGRGLRTYFPEIPATNMYHEIDRLFLAEVQKHLGLTIDTGRLRPDPNAIVEEYRRQKAAEPLPPQDPRVTQDMLREEFKRLQVNRRTFWVAPKESPGRKHTFVLHEGVIEMRAAGNKVLAFGLLEPAGAVNFYKSIPYPRQEPDPVRLRLLYDAAAGPRPSAQQDRKEKAPLGTRVRTELAGAGQFAGAFLIKESLKAAVIGDPGMIANAALQMKDPMFWGSLAAFTASARGAEKALSLRRAQKFMPARFKGIAGTAVPLAAGMAVTEALSGHPDPKRIAVSTGSYLGAGAAIQAVTSRLDGVIRAATLGAGTPGRVAFGAYTMFKFAGVLLGGEQAEAVIMDGLEGRDIFKEMEYRWKQATGGMSTNGSH